MVQNFRSYRRFARLRTPLLAIFALTFAGCQSSDSFSPASSTPPDATVPGTPTSTPTGGPAFSTGFAGGIPMGIFALPTSQFGSRYNGAMRNIWPDDLVGELAAIKSRGGKVVLMMAGNERYYKDSDGHFSLSKWKARVDRFRHANFNTYINDGTVIAHYLIDEPNDPANWNGRPVRGSTVEEMARYSKAIWPGMPTVVRVDPGYLKGDGPYRYLDAAWAQYVYRKGAADDYIRRNVADAQNLGLQLITGLNVLKGGVNGSKMSASQVSSWGSTLLNSYYPCAFISWEYDYNYLSTSGMRDAMDGLRRKAQNRSTKNCRG